VKAVLAEVAEHPEMALSRRQILRFILVEPTKRSEEIQTILKLDGIGQIRATLNTAHNRLQAAQRTAATQMQSARNTLLRHLQSATLRAADVLEAVNQRRIILGLPEIADLTADTRLDAGLSTDAKVPEFNKVSALRDLKTLSDAAVGFPTLVKAEATAIVTDLSRLEADPGLLTALQQRLLIEKGLELVDGPECPLCDTPWGTEQQLRDYLSAKLVRSTEAQKVQQQLVQNGTTVAQAIIRVMNLIATAQKLADAESDAGFARLLSEWGADLEELRRKLANVDGLTGLKDRLSGEWIAIPTTFHDGLQGLTARIEAKPDQSATIDAQTFLNTAQIRLGDYRETRRKKEAAEIALATAKAAYDDYCTVMDDELNALYDDVQEDFSTYYRAINEDNESKFTAKLTPSAGRLDFDVNFYQRGLFPPGAYHSEGHQDGMGVCLYLALMKRLFHNRFKFALLDDVVMSVDVGHRRQFCKVLKTYFPDTQFIITTHDRLWAEQMKSAGLVTGKTSLAFHGWSIDTGPVVEANQNIWDDIAAELAKGSVGDAAGALRRHLEYESRHLADELGAMIPFRADGNYELGELLPNVLSCLKTLYGKAAAAAQSWGNLGLRDTIVARRDAFSEAAAAQNVEQWAVNKAVHYNEWANFDKKDFQPVVTAFKDLMDCFHCPDCHSWLHVMPRAQPETLRCLCGATSFNLKPKLKQITSRNQLSLEMT
jgi:hypothetical protein